MKHAGTRRKARTSEKISSTKKKYKPRTDMATNKQQWNRRHGFDPDQSHTKARIARISHVPLALLRRVYDRGIGAYKTNPQSVRVKGTYQKGVIAPMSLKLSKEQWAMARVYSFVNKLEGPRNLNHDADLARLLASDQTAATKLRIGGR